MRRANDSSSCSTNTLATGFSFPLGNAFTLPVGMKKKQRVKNTATTTTDGKFSLNQLLDTLAEECEAAYNRELPNGIPAPETLKAYLQAIIDQNRAAPEKDTPTLFKLIDRFISGEIKNKGKKKKRLKTWRITNISSSTSKVTARHTKRKWIMIAFHSISFTNTHLTLLMF